MIISLNGMKLLVEQLLVEHPVGDGGKQFNCTCHGGTQFIVYATYELPHASCPVCGTVCEPAVRTTTTISGGTFASTHFYAP